MTQPTTASAKSWYSIRRPNAADADQAPAEIHIYGDIGDSWYADSVTAAQFVKDIGALDVDAITVRINSVGGSVPDGIAIYNAIKRHKAKVTTAVDGMALSIASLIAMAGDEVEMAENALMMVHAPWTYAGGNSADLRAQADVLDTWAGSMASSYVAKTGKSREDIMALLTDGVDHWYTAEEAKAFGYVNTITQSLPASASAALQASAGQNRQLTQHYAALQARLLAQPEASGTPSTRAAALAARAMQSTAAAAAITQESNHMPNQNPTPAAASQTATPDAAAILAADQQRRQAVRAKFAAFAQHEGVSAILQSCEDDAACTPEAAATKLLAHLGAHATPIAGHIVTTVEDESDKRRAAAVDAIMARAGVATAEQRKHLSANPLRGSSLLDLARSSLRGTRVDGMDKMQIVASAFTQGTSDFPVLLETAMHKTLQNAYATAADTWSRFCARGSVSDFRDHKRYRVGSLGNLVSKNELGEYVNKAIPDGEKSTIAASTKGYIINLSREAVVNDDLAAFIGLSAMMGRAARRTVEADVYATLALNSGLGPLLADGKTLFHADHGNITTTAAITVAALDLDRVAMASQKDVSGNDYLDLRPQVLVVPIAIGGTARVLNNAEYDPDTANKLQRPNMVRGLFADIVDSPRLSGTRRYLFANPGDAPVLEVAFLDGNDTPYLETDSAFTTDGARYKVRLDYGIAGIDYRGAVTNAG